jgi:transaldolase
MHSKEICAAMTLLDSLKKQTIIVADTGDIEAIAKHKPQDATTNPSLLLKAAPQPHYRALVDEALKFAGAQSSDESQRKSAFMEKLAVNFGCEILKIIPGRVSTEVDASFSFDTEGTIAKARNYIELYGKAGIDQERILIKVGTTWEGIRAAEILEKEGIHCNMTLLFSFAQAVAAAEAKVTLISPFVGRIYDYYLKARGVKDIPARAGSRRGIGRAHLQPLQEVRLQDPGHGGELPQDRTGDAARRLRSADHQPRHSRRPGKREGELPRRLSVASAKASDATPLHLDEKAYRFMHNQDAMAVDKLSDGIRHFYADARKLESWAAELLAKCLAILRGMGAHGRSAPASESCSPPRCEPTCVPRPIPRRVLPSMRPCPVHSWNTVCICAR